MKPWINFEMGCAWIKKIPILPICHSGQEINSLPIPISTSQALDIHSATFVDNLMQSIAKYLDIKVLPRIDKEAMKEEIRKAVESSLRASEKVDLEASRTPGEKKFLIK